MDRDWLISAIEQAGSRDSLAGRRVLADVRRALFEEDSEPTQLDRFHILDVLGRGATGTVYAAYDPKLDRKIALKVFPRSKQPSTRSVRREATIAARLNHPNVVTVHDFGEVDRRAWVAMEFVAGQSLRQRLGALPRPWSVVRPLFSAAARGLEAAHAAGVVHRDFKPDNVLVGDDGRVRVADFGLALSVGAAQATEAGFAGTPAYMAPEQLRGEATDIRTDQFSFCVALFEALVGERPFVGATAGQLLEDMANRAPDVDRIPGVPTALRRAVARGLAMDPADRHPDMHPLLAALEPPASSTAPRRGTMWLAMGVASAALAIALGLMATDEMANEPCASAGVAIEAVWSTSVRERVHQALEAPGFAVLQTRALDELDAWGSAWVGDVEASCRATHVEQTQSAEALDLRSACYREALAGFEAAVDILAVRSDVTRANAHTVLDGLPELDPCRDVGALKARPELDEVTAARAEALSVELQRSATLADAGHAAEALEVLDAADAELESLDVPRLRVRAMSERAGALAVLGDDDRAIEAAQRTLELSLVFDDNIVLDDALMLLTSLMGHLGDVSRGKVYAQMLEARTRREGVGAVELAALSNALGAFGLGAGEYEDAAERFERAMELRKAVHGEDMAYSAYLNGLAVARSYAGRTDDALAAHEEVLAIRKRLVGEQHPYVAETLEGIATELRQRNDYERALRYSEQARAIIQHGAPNHESLGQNANGRGQALAHLGRMDEAREAFEDAVEHFELAYPDGGRVVAVCRMNLAKFLAEEFRAYDEAAALAEQALRMHLELLGPRHPELVVARAHHGQLLDLAGDVAAGRGEIERAVALGSEVLGPEHADTLYAKLRLAALEVRAERWDVAERLAAEVDAALRLHPSAPPSLAAASADLLAQARSRRRDEP